MFSLKNSLARKVDRNTGFLKLEKPGEKAGAAEVEQYLLKGLNHALLYLLNNDNFDQALSDAFEIIGEITGSDGIFLFENLLTDKRKLVARQQFALKKTEGQWENMPPSQREFSLESELQLELAKAVKVGKSVYGKAGDFPEKELALLQSLDVAVFLLYPVMVDYRLWGVLGLVSSNKDKKWIKNQQNILEPFAFTLGNLIARKEAEKALKESESLQKATLNALPDLKFRINKEGKYLSFYPSEFDGENPFLPHTDIQGENLSEMLPDFVVRAFLHNTKMAIDNKSVQSFEYALLINGKRNYFEARVSAVNDKEVIAIVRNISESKKIEFELNERLRELDIKNKQLKEYIDSNLQLENFAYIASHDLREPLRTVRTFAQLLLHKYADSLDDSAQTYINFIVDGSSHMNDLIEDILTFSRINTDEHYVEEIVPEKVLSEVTNSLGDVIKENEAVIGLEALPPVIIANRTKIKQLFQNLISNAIKFHQTEQPPNIRISGTEMPSHWQFVVNDNGIGIEKEFQDRIFLLFKKLHNKQDYKGTGLGLAICKKIAEQHEGDIWVESEFGKGSAFYFTIKKGL